MIRLSHRQVFLGAAIIVAASALPAWAQYTDTPYLGAALNLANERIDQMDQQLRSLTGKIEENQFLITQLKEAQEKQLGDMSRRLQDIEVRLNSTGVANVDAAQAAPQTSAASKPVAGEEATPPTTVMPEITDPNAPLTTTAPSVKPLGSVTESGNPQPGTPEAEYEAAYTLLKDKDYEGAQNAFAVFLKTNPNHDLAGNAQYWLGETHYARKDYKNAAKAFAEGYQKYRRAPKAADNLYKLGVSLAALDNKDDACVTLFQFKKEYQDAAATLKARADDEIKKLGCGG